MNLKATLNATGKTLIETGSPDAQLEAEVLIRHVLRIDRATFLRDLEEPVTEYDRDVWMVLWREDFAGSL